MKKERLNVRKWDPWLTEDGLLRIRGWARDGLIDKDIAKSMHVSYSTLRAWRDRFPEIAEALSQGKDAADRVVENALYMSATGFTKTVRKPVKVKQIDYDPETGKKVAEREKYIAVEEEIFVPPQVTAQIFWLKNRKPEQWRDKQEYTDTTALDKLDAILAENIKNANRQAK